MKQLIALAAVLGLAVSSWGLTPPDVTEAQAAPGITAAIVPEAQVGYHVGRGLANALGRADGHVIHYYDNFGWDGLFGGHLATIAGTIGGLVGGATGFAIGGPPGALAGTIVGAY